MPKPLHHPRRVHRSGVELRIIKERKVNLTAHSRNVGLIEEELGGTSPCPGEREVILQPGTRQSSDVGVRITN
jgi:hypothetical protein